MEALEIIAVLAELAAVAQGIDAAIRIVKQAKADGVTHIGGETLARVRAAMLSGCPVKSILEPPAVVLTPEKNILTPVGREGSKFKFKD